MINAKKANELASSNGIFCGALAVYRNKISDAISIAISDKKFEVFIRSDELHQQNSELSKMIFGEIRDNGYSVSSHYTKKYGCGIIISW